MLFMIQPPAPQFSNPVFTQEKKKKKKTLKVNELVHLHVYQKSKLIFLSSPMQLGSKWVSNFA